MANGPAASLTPGQHGIHLHAVGRCEPAAFTTAGGHFNPTTKKHGLKSPDGPHGGDLPNLTADASGQARYTTTTTLVTLTTGPTSLLDADGAALVIHAGPDDDLTDPAGNSGDRVACAVLNAAPAMPRTGDGGAQLPDSAPILGLGSLVVLLMMAGHRAWRRRDAA